MECAVPREAFYGRDLGAVFHHREGQAGIDPPAVDKHRAGAALAVITAFLRAGQIKVIAQRVEQRDPGPQLELRLCSVDGEGDWNRVGD